MSDIEYSLVGFREAFPKIKDLVSKQWEEVDHRRKTSKLKVMEETYNGLEDSGVHFLVIAESLGEVVGYISMFCTKSPHTGELHSTTDTIFVSPSVRGAGVGKGLIRLAEEESVVRGAKHMMVTFKNEFPHDNIVEDLGFFSYETVYSKALGGEG